MNSLVGYWRHLSSIKRFFLVVGLIVTLPIVVVLIIVAGIAEVWKLIQNMEF